MSASTSAPVVYVDGANGFVGTATVLELIKRGHKVKAIVRRQASADAFNAKYPEDASSIEWAFVPDLLDQSAVSAAAQGVDYMIHIASPFNFSFKDNVNEILIPARDGTLVALRAAAENPRIKHVVITSSFASIMDVLKGTWPEKTYSEEDWNPATWDEAAVSDNPGFVYCASKVIAEKAAWDFVEKEKPQFVLTTFCPPMIFGPPSQPFTSLDKLNESVGGLWQMFNIRDLAYLQVAALTNEKAKNQRYLSIGGHYSNDQVVAIAAAAFPAQAARMTPTTGNPPPEHFKTDTSKAERDFHIQWTPLNKVVEDTAEALFKAEAQFAGSSA